MSDERTRYSLITVEVASDEEPTVRVDAAGVHPVHDGAEPVEPAAYDEPVVASAAESAVEIGSGSAAEAAVGDGRAAAASASGSASRAASDREQDLDDLDAPVPFANMRRVIFALLVVALVAFVGYFMFMRG